MTPRLMFDAAWILMVLSWIAAAAWSGRTEARAVDGRPGAHRYRIAFVAGAVMFPNAFSRAVHAHRVYALAPATAYALLAATVAGFAFTWWARVTLGRMWSGTITRKEGHRIITAGPYGLVRHPIYTGLFLSTVATALAKATWPAFAAAFLLIFSLTWKAKIEEGFLDAELADGAYAAYRRRVPMLIPFIGPRG